MSVLCDAVMRCISVRGCMRIFQGLEPCAEGRSRFVAGLSVAISVLCKRPAERLSAERCISFCRIVLVVLLNVCAAGVCILVVC